MTANKKYNVIISDRAKAALGRHIRFMAQINRDAAITKKNELVAAMRSLETMPERFPFFNEPLIPPNRFRKMFVAKWYLVIYRVAQDSVYVDMILDCRQDNDTSSMLPL